MKAGIVLFKMVGVVQRRVQKDSPTSGTPLWVVSMTTGTQAGLQFIYFEWELEPTE